MNRQEYEAEKSLNLNASPEGTEYATVLGNLLLAERYIASLESEVEQLKAENAALREDNIRLIEQVNEAGVKYEKELKMSSELTDKVKSLLGNCLYHCNRVWEAWQYGTMTEDDFILAKEDSDIVNDFVAFVNDEVKSVENALRAELEKTQKALDLACDFTVLNAGETVTHWKEYYLKKAGE